MKIFGKFARLDGKPLVGEITFTPTSYFIENSTVIIPSQVRVILDSDGGFEIDLRPSDYSYRVEEDFGTHRRYQIMVPGTGESHNLETLRMVS